jgi:hypothetical protein
MDTDVQQFAAMFENEVDLQRAIASTLRKMPGVSGVEITQGTHEHGKDIIFYRPGGLGEPKLYACVVKNEKITGTVDSNRGAKTVLSQAEQAFDEPYITGDGSPEKVEHVYIICPHECSQSTMDSIAGRLSKHPVTFVCGGKLIDLFQQHWPQFLMFNSSLLSSYVANLKRGLDEDSPLKYLSGRHPILAGAIESFSRVYVKQDFYKALRKHRLTLDVPNLKIVKDPISLEQSREMQHALKQLSAFVAASEIWNLDVELSKRQQIKSSLIDCADLIESLWSKGYEQDRREKSKEAAQVTTRREALVRIADPNTILRVQDETADIISRLLEELTVLVDRANRFVSAQLPSPDRILGSEEFLKYCIVVEVNQRISDIVSATGPESYIEFSDGVVGDVASAILISGPAGYGKSSYCKWNALADITQLAADKKARLPIYVPLHKLSRETSQNPIDTFFRAPELKELVTDAKYSNSIAGIRLYLDGLDEVPSSERQQELMGLAMTLCQEDRRISLVLTARDHVCGPWLNWMPRVRIKQFSVEQSNQLLANSLEDETMRSEFRRQLELAPTLLSLMQVPLLATLIIAVFRNLQRLPESKTRLYEMFVELMSGGWDLAKNVKRDVKFGSVMKIRLLSRLAGSLQLNQKRDCSQAEIQIAMRDVMSADIAAFPDLLQELIEDGLLVCSGNIYYFSHQSFQEYLAAKDLADPSGRRQTQVLKWFLEGNDWWREVVLFYISMQRPQDVEIWIRKEVEQLTPRSAHVGNRIKQEFHLLMENLQLTFSGYQPRSFEIRPQKRQLTDPSISNSSE